MIRKRFSESLPRRANHRLGGAWGARAAVLFALSLSLLSCLGIRLTGTSSGVDNPASAEDPSITVSFTDANGTAARVTGDLDVYAADQVPAVDAGPLATIKVRNSALTFVTGDDFKRAQQAATKRTAAQGSAAQGSAASESAEPGKRVAFNLIFRTLNQKGGIALGLAYDSAARTFSRSDSSVKSVTFVPEPLVRYAARIAKEPVHGDNCRVFVPGTPFLATLVDSQFVLEGLPQGRLPLSLIGADGRIYPVADSLNTADSGKVYRPSPTPSGSIDTAGSVDTIPDFGVKAAPKSHVAYADTLDFLEAQLTGISPNDPRLSVLWKSLPDLAPKPDTSLHDAHAGEIPPPYAEILAPTSLRTGIRYHGDGVFHFLVSATVGTRTRTDTALVSVYHQTPQPPAIIYPAPADSLVLGRPVNVQWRMPGDGPYDIELSLNRGEAWTSLEKGFVPPPGVQVYVWTPSIGLTPSDRYLLRVTDASDTTQHAVMEGPFSLIH